MRNLKNDKNAAMLTIVNILSLIVVIIINDDLVFYQWSDGDEVSGEAELKYSNETDSLCFDIEGATYYLNDFVYFNR